MKDQILVTIEKINPSIVILSLNRQEKRNALNISLLNSLRVALNELKEDSSIRALIIKGEGSSFCSGLDLKEASEESTIKQSNLLLKEVFLAIYHCPFLTIAAVHGSAIAGGAGIMSACDFVIASEKTIFGYPEVKRGLVAAQVMVFLNKQLKYRDIQELLLLGELIDADRALSIGLINRIVRPENLIEEALNIAKIALKNGPEAIKKTKELLDSLTGNLSLDLDKMMVEGEKIRASKEAKEGILAFLEQRPPNFSI